MRDKLSASAAEPRAGASRELLKAVKEADTSAARAKVMKQLILFQVQETAVLVLMTVAFIGGGAIFYSFTEGWEAIRSIYFCLVTFSTVGYGGDVPSHPGTKVFTIFYITAGIIAVTYRMEGFLARMADYSKSSFDTINKIEADAASQEAGYGTADARSKHVTVEEPLPAWRYYATNAGFASCIVIIWLLVAALIFCWTEHWQLSYLDSFFFVFITATTVGYGDTEITTVSSMTFACFFILVEVVTISALLSHFSSLRAARGMELRRWRLGKQSTDPSLLLEEPFLLELLKGNAKGRKYDRLSFITQILTYHGIVDAVEIRLAEQYFELLDTSNDGFVDMDELFAEVARAVACQPLGTQPPP